MEQEEGIKYDDSKVLMSEFLNSKAFGAVSAVLTFGAKKYERGNWRKGFADERLYDAAIGHLYSAIRGEKLDEETKLPHIAHAICCLTFLLEHEDLPEYGRNFVAELSREVILDTMFKEREEDGNWDSLDNGVEAGKLKMSEILQQEEKEIQGYKDALSKEWEEDESWKDYDMGSLIKNELQRLKDRVSELEKEKGEIHKGD